ncbi:MAG: aminotransferase class I/II-fold pyridoxal phosphate-dependent enzyme [Deltaproteobacteria bacterium]|nr:aminotransferase class I/II-fold pyridoxal phosphate-dependent enzyme [Deltaproteobacteria bacterium]
MRFDSNSYLKWYMPRMRRDDAVNLHASGVPSLTPADIELRPYDPWRVAEEFEPALAAWLGIDAESVLFTPGATGGTLLALLSLTAAGDELLVELPTYEPMLRQAARVGNVRRFRRSPESGWQLPVDEIGRLLSPRTKLVMITEPSNPSGTFARREDVLAVADLAATRGALVLVNEVYLGFSERPTLCGARDNIVVVSSLSKLLGAYWLRLGWLAARPDLVQRLRWGHMNLSMATKPAAAYGLGVLARADEWRARARATAAAGLEPVDRWVRATPGVSWIKPQGPGFGCVRLPDGVADDVAFAEKLQDELRVLVVPGTHFELPGTLRLSWLQAGDRLQEGLERISRALR